MITAKRYKFVTSTNKLDVTKTQAVDLVNDQNGNLCWQITTHDRDDKDYYQIAFSSNNDPKQVVMRIESPMLNGDDGQNNLLQSEEYDGGVVLWHQKCVPDYVTCAGIFRVVEQNLTSGDVVDISPWIYCLPSSISVTDYQIMLYDLLEMHDSLIQRKGSRISAGGNDIESWADQLVTAIHRIQRADTNVTYLKKHYIRTRIENIKRFDSHVIQSYIKNGLVGTAEGIVYKESNDVYENRIIKRAISLISQRLKTTYQIPESQETTADMNNTAPAPNGHSERGALERQRFKQLEMEKKERKKLQKQKVKDRQTAIKVSKKLEDLLSEKWFSSIADIDGNVFPIVCTPVFSRNESYSIVYKLLSDFSKSHSALNCNIDINGFGVKKTCDIYELWVLYSLLYKLDSLDFKLDDDQLTSILEDFREHISGEKIPKQYKVVADKMLDDGVFMQIEFGYNCFLPSREAPHPYTPDYYIKVKRSNQNHWYFMDAKYKSYYYNSRPSFGMFSLTKDVQDVAYKKYTIELGKQLSGKICGAYLIASSIDQRKPSIDDISSLHLLCGGEKALDGDSSFPDHKYGAIQLTPSSKFELDTLFKLIFEYKESEDRLPDHTPFLNYCWACGKKMNIVPWDDPEMGHANKNVIYRKCTCEEFRVESYCRECHSLIIKHSIGNYHHSYKGDRWNIICPHCGDYFEPILNVTDFR